MASEGGEGVGVDNHVEGVGSTQWVISSGCQGWLRSECGDRQHPPDHLVNQPFQIAKEQKQPTTTSRFGPESKWSSVREAQMKEALALVWIVIIPLIIALVKNIVIFPLIEGGAIALVKNIVILSFIKTFCLNLGATAILVASRWISSNSRPTSKSSAATSIPSRTRESTNFPGKTGD